MLRKIMSNKIIRYKFHVMLFGLAFAGGIFLPNFSGPETVSAINYGDDKYSLEEAVIAFHTQMNDIANGYIKKLLKTKSPNVSYPAADDECESDNVSTFCLAVKLNAELKDFELEISGRKDDFKEPGDTAVYSLEEAAQSVAERRNFIANEIGSARETLDLTLATYNEIQNVYPIHKELVTLIKNLETYRSNLADIRNEIAIYPAKFNDATTIECK